jgi:hypothetical protein
MHKNRRRESARVLFVNIVHEIAPVAFSASTRLSSASISIMRLFLYVLDRCVDISARVVLETLVSESDFLEVNGGVLDTKVDWQGYRLWIPLGPDGVEAFSRSIRSSFAENMACDALEAEPRRKPAKRRKIPVVANLPPPRHLRRVTSPHELCMLARLYAVGRGMTDTVSSAQDGAAAPARSDAWLGTGAGAAADADNDATTRELLGCLDTRRYFAALDADKHASRADLYTVQQHADSYVRSDTTGGSAGLVFAPLATLTPLVRGFVCGNADDFIRLGSHELMGYLLPHLEPSDGEIRRWLERVLSATGRHVSLDGKSRTQLIQAAEELNTSRTESLSDNGFSDTGDGLADTAQQTSLFAATMSGMYPAVTSLHAKNSRTLEHYSSAGDAKGYHTTMARVARNLGAVLSAPHVKGEPEAFVTTLCKNERSLCTGV